MTKADDTENKYLGRTNDIWVGEVVNQRCRCGGYFNDWHSHASNCKEVGGNVDYNGNFYLARRIAHEGYPASEANYGSIFEYVEDLEERLGI